MNKAMKMRETVEKKYGRNSETFRYFQYVFSHRDTETLEYVYNRIMEVR